MSGKGDTRRPMTVQQELFADNWERAFQSSGDHSVETVSIREVRYDGEPVGTFDATNLREVRYDGMWKHSCTVDLSVVWIGKNETCDYCGAWEEDDE